MRIGRLAGFTALGALLVVVVLDVSSPLLARRDLGAVASQLARAGHDRYLATADEQQAGQVVRERAAAEGVGLARFEIETGGAVRVTITTTARSYLGARLGLGKYYAVQATSRHPIRPRAPTSTTRKG